MKQIVCMTLLLLLINTAQSQKELRITGTVMSAATHEAISGASLTIKGTGISVASGNKGDFSLLAPAKHLLVITHIGFTTKAIDTDSIGDSPLTILLAEGAVTLEDVTVSTGYQEIKKGSATGSYEKIDNNLFNRSTGTDIISRLDGVAGAVFFDHRANADAPIQIRGISTLGISSTSPLIILDNFPYEGDINNINPEDVASVTVLKDASAASIWGARAGNGVIVITTKKGKFGQPFRLSVNADVIASGKPDLFKQRNMTTSDFIDLEKVLFDKGYYNSRISNTRNYYPVSPVVEILAKQRSGTLNAADAESQIDALRLLDVRNDFAKYLYRPGTIQQYGLNISGGGSIFKYYLSGGYDRTISTLVGNGEERFTVRSGNTYMPLKNLQIDFQLAYTNSNNQRNSPGGYSDLKIARTASALYPYTKFADASGNPASIDYFYRRSFTDTAGAGILLDWNYSPLNELHNVSRVSVSDALTADAGLKYFFSKSLNAEVKYQYQVANIDAPASYNVHSFEARNLINEFTQYDGTNITYNVPYGGILDASRSTLRGYGLRGQLNFNTTFHNKNVVDAIAGAEVRQTENSSSSYRTYGFDDKLNYTDVDLVNTYPTFDNIDGIRTIPSGSGFASTLDRYVSIYANASDTYNHLYTLSASFRKDASNLFGVRANQKGLPLWSAGVGWNICGATFYHLQWLPLLKLRATYGYSGNVSHSVSALATISYTPAALQPITNVPFSVISNYPNPNLQWEKVRMANLGFDFGSKNNRIAGSIEYYEKKSIDVIAAKSVDGTLGTFFLITNSADLKGHGFDITVNSRNIVTKDFEWQTSVLFNSLNTKITRYLNDAYTDGYTSNGKTISPLQGYEPYLIVSYKWAGLDSAGNPQGFLNGKKSADYYSIFKTPLKDQSISGSAIPLYYGYVRNTVHWNRLTFSVNIAYRLKYYFRKPTLNYIALFRQGIGNSDYERRWQKTGDENTTTVPSMIYPYVSSRENFYQNADINVLKADNIKANDIRIGYQIDGNIMRKMSLQRAEVYAYVSNLNITLWKANKEGIDPDFPTGLMIPVNISVGIKTDF
jgi:TonB-linked SusC/RagA family outer membrane protein